jgi:pyruvate dehydrogenase E2 component (dihydrolipoamide acetyltransferase)/2-oxoglutarate dehydrogenase E2 component (dihydrolipoamide succinyltransferase)
VNLDPVLKDRQSRDPKPGLGLYALRALASLLPKIRAAAKLIGGRVVESSSIDIGIAVEARMESWFP